MLNGLLDVDFSRVSSGPIPTALLQDEQKEFDAWVSGTVAEQNQARRDDEFENECRAIVERVCAKELLSLAKSKRTRRDYLAEMRSFVEDCKEWGVTALPAGPATVAAYLLDLASNGAGEGKLIKARAAIGYAHSIKGMPDPTDSPLVQAVMRKAKAIKANGHANGAAQ